ncbi:MAG: PrsW family intramembrane metalloprotease [Anaerolineales bacterium]
MNGLLLSCLTGFGPMALYAWLLFSLDRYEKEPLPLLLGVFSWGAVIAAGGAFIINSFSSLGVFLLTRSDLATQLTVSGLIAPIAEESLKGAAVLLIFLAFRSEFDSPLDGIIYAGITALGFAATENIWYIHQLGYLQNGFQGLIDLAIIRSILVGWQHPFYTAFIGLGLALSRDTRKPILQWVYPILGWSLAVFFHVSHNLLANLSRQQGYFGLPAVWDWSGYLGLLLLIRFLITREQKWMKVYLAPEAAEGIITAFQYQSACSASRQTLTLIKGVFNGSYSQQRKFYQSCGNLMHKKRLLTRDGDQLGEALEIQHLRSILASLRPALEKKLP